MNIAIMQPTYLPWIGYFDLIDSVDKFIFYDDVQVVKRSWNVRNRIKTPQGELYLSLPIKKTKHRDITFFHNAELNDQENWISKHLKSIELNYKKSTYFTAVYELISHMLLKKHKYLGDLNIEIIQTICNKINIQTNFIRASEFEGISGAKDERLVAICKKVGADQYVSPQGSAVYIEEEKPGGEFPENSIQLYYHNYEHPIYKQLYSDFLPYLGIIDLLFNEGFENSLQIIRSGRREVINYKDFREMNRHEFK